MDEIPQVFSIEVTIISSVI